MQSVMRHNKTPVRTDTRSTTSPSPVAQNNVISFVAFDSNPSDASRKAVRKQAALASAATRKATIARKVAKQKEHDDRQRQRFDTAVAGASNNAQLQDRAKRKRPAPADWSPQSYSTGDLHAQAYTWISEDASQQQRRKRPQPRIVSAYLSPPASATVQPSIERDWTLRQPLEHSLESTSRVLALVGGDTTPPYNHDQQIIPTKPRCWSVSSEDNSHSEDCHLPPTPESLDSPISVAASIAAGKMDPFNHYPVEYHPIYDRLLHHMLTIFAPRGWPTLRISIEEGLAWEHFMTQHALAEPALFLVRVLFASGDLIRLNVLEPKIAVALRSLAIKAINEAIADPTRSISDGLILAVGRIALTESLYGDRHAANAVHRPAQRRMIEMRGGIGVLNIPPLVKRLMRWADNVMSLQSNTPRLLPDNEDEGNTTWDIEQSVGVLEDWVPQEGQEMRKKIAISDLIT